MVFTLILPSVESGELPTYHNTWNLLFEEKLGISFVFNLFIYWIWKWGFEKHGSLWNFWSKWQWDWIWFFYYLFFFFVNLRRLNIYQFVPKKGQILANRNKRRVGFEGDHTLKSILWWRWKVGKSGFMNMVNDIDNHLFIKIKHI